MESVGILLVFVLFLFFLIGMNVFRANKHRRQSEDLINSLKKGDKVKTFSGLYGKIVEIKEVKDEDDIVKEKIAVIEIAKDVNVNVDARSIFEKDSNIKI